MSDDEEEDWMVDCPDAATERAAALVDLAINYDTVKNPKVKQAMLKAMDLLNEGLEIAVRGRRKKQPGTLILFQRPDPPGAA